MMGLEEGGEGSSDDSDEDDSEEDDSDASDLPEVYLHAIFFSSRPPIYPQHSSGQSCLAFPCFFLS